ncbi:helix-turn-helix domain-containing protein [Pelagibacteraceae bacterium]|nr:helix-turn-helix domain-containing protein [Pelagibacteraceae bacterium]
MKNKLNIFSDKKIKFFLKQLFSDYELFFIDLTEIQKYIENTGINIIFIKDKESIKLIDFKKLSDNFLILSNQKNKQLITIPKSINSIKNIVEHFVENLKFKFHDITIVNEKLTNINNNSFCYLTKLESEILTYLIIEKESTKKYIQENILNIKSTIQTNSLDSHLTRIRKKMYKIKTSVKIQSKSEKLLIKI